MGGAGLATAAVVLAALAAPTSAVAPDPAVAAVMAHLEAFDRIAAENGGNRAAGTPGYEASAAYVEQVLRDAGYVPERQDFVFHTQEVETETLTVTGGTPEVEANAMTFTTGTDADGVTAGLVAPAEPLGCDADAWKGVDVAGRIALVGRGTCALVVKSQVAAAVGAVGLVVHNNDADPDKVLGGTFTVPTAGTVPSVGISRTAGDTLLAELAQRPVEATLVIEETTTQFTTFNVIAETEGGRADNVVMLGAHLDSVPEAPGINDNGSGSAAILQAAVDLADGPAPANRVRFAWFGAEEYGLYGSNAYIASLDEEQAGDIAAYLNVDMIASPNYVIGIYDADESTFEAPVTVPPGSSELEDLLTDFLDAQGKPWVDVAFDGRSDYQGFIESGIAAAGIFTGAEQLKTAEEAALFGGVAGQAYDPSYHQPGDDLSDVSQEALAITVPAINDLTASLAADTWPVNGVKRPTTTTLRLTGKPAAAVRVTGATTGTVHLRDGRRTIGTVELDDGRATLALDGLRPGRHRIVAVLQGTDRTTRSRDAEWLRVARG